MPSTTFFNLPEEKRSRLLLAAREEFSRVPFAEASINRIIHSAGIPRGSFYMYFEDKEDLFRYLLENHVQGLLHQLLDILHAEQGDLFASFRVLFEQLTSQTEQDNSFVELASILQRNAGLQQGPVLSSISPRTLIDSILPEIDRSRLSLRRESDLGDILTILVNVTIPALCAGRRDPDFRERYLARLDILSRGMSASQAASPA